MAPAKKRRKVHLQTSDRPPASDPNPTTTSPSTSVATGGTATASFLPSSALPSAPPTATTQPVQSVSIPSPSSALAIATNQPSPPAPPLSIQEAHQEHISSTSVRTSTTADSAGPSTAPSASAASTSTPTVFMPKAQVFLSHILPRFVSTMLEMEELCQLLMPDVTGLEPHPMRRALRTFFEAAEKEMKAASDFAAGMKDLKVTLDTLLEENKKRDIESGDSCGCCKVHFETSDRPPASDPNPTTTSPYTSVATGGTATASFLPSFALPSAPPTTTTQPVRSVSIPSPSSALAIATNQPLPPAPPLSIQETHQEHISSTSVRTSTIADSAGPSTAPSASAASTNIPQVFPSRILPRFVSTMLEMEELCQLIPDVTGLEPQPMRRALRTFLEAAEKEMKAESDFVAGMKDLKVTLDELGTLQEENKKAAARRAAAVMVIATEIAYGDCVFE